MKVVQISGFDLLGIQVNGYLIHEFARAEGHDSAMFVHSKFSDDPDVYSLFNRYLSRINRWTVALQDRLSLWSFLPVEAFILLRRCKIWKADIVHCHLVYNTQFFSLFLIPLLSLLKWRSHVLVSIHDMFMMTGHCIYSLGCERWMKGCGSCPDLGVPFPVARDTTRLSWLLKRLIFRLSRVHLVVGSPWQMRQVTASPILRHLPVHYVPYGVDTRVYRLRDKLQCRKRFGIADDTDVIAFRSVPFSRNFKGTEYIIEALNLYKPKKKTCLLTFEGIGGLETLEEKYDIVQLEWTNDDQDLIADGLNAADVFLMPSIAEGFGLMAVESLACGTPVIVFEGTALPETIDAPNCGIAVPMKDHVALSRALADLLSDRELRERLAANGVKHANQNHNFDDYAMKYLALYQELHDSKSMRTCTPPSRLD